MLRKIFILTVFLALNVFEESNAQNLKPYPNYSELPSYNYDDFRTTVSDSSSTIWPYIIAIESLIIGYSYLSTYTWGAYYTGGSYAGGAALLGGFLLFSDYDMNPEITIPAAIGYAALGYYNIRFADSHSKTRKFWTNMIGIHSVNIGSFVIGGLMTKNKSDPKGLSIQPGLSSFKVFYNF